jgi:hypothetical protein
MYENERQAREAPFARDPRSVPLYVPQVDQLPLWPELWRLRGWLLVFGAGVAFFGSLGMLVTWMEALLG